MNKNKNLPYLIGGGLLLVGVGGYFLHNYLKNKRDLRDSRKTDEETPSTPNVDSDSSSPEQTLSTSFPISFGTNKNANVKTLQEMLKTDANGNKLDNDGSWGKLTEGAMNKYGYYKKVISSKSDLANLGFSLLQKKRDANKPAPKSTLETLESYEVK